MSSSSALYASSSRTWCRKCGKYFDNRGFDRHRKKHLRDEIDETLDAQWRELQVRSTVVEEATGGRVHSRRERSNAASSSHPYVNAHGIHTANQLLADEDSVVSTLPHDMASAQPCSQDMPTDPQLSLPPSSSPSPSPLPSPPPLTPSPSANAPLHDLQNAPESPSFDDIKVEYHPNATQKTTTYKFEQYHDVRPKINFAAMPDDPWRPFESRGDFEFAEIVHEARMSREVTERLLKLIHDIRAGDADLTFTSHRDMRQAWERASNLYPTFSCSTISAVYKSVNHDFSFYHRSLWDWVVAQVEDKKLAPHFHWDAQRLSKYNGDGWVRFYEEPWTADMFWEVQTEIAAIDPDGKPLGLILWADKDKLSTFGTQKGHPIVARLSNLDGSIRNSLGIGGGRIVGLVPIINDDPAEKSKKDYIDWKHAIYHEAFRILLEHVAAHSRTGYRVKCGDQHIRTLYPFIHIITADYEEQCYFALTRGLHRLLPCPVCTVPKGSLSDLATLYPEREENKAQEVVEEVGTKKAKENKLKKLGLRGVKNALWDVARTNIHKALSFDRLHAYLLGLFLHLLQILKAIIGELDRKTQAFIDQSLNAVPSWPDLTHFSSLTNTDFNDGSKWADLSKIIIQCCYSIFPIESSGYKLLKALRKYVECDTYVALPVQTSETLEDYDATVQQFGHLLADYSESTVNNGLDMNLDRDWDGIIKLARLDDLTMILCDIRGAIDAREEYIASQEEAEKQLRQEKEHPTQFNHIYLGSPRAPVKISALAEAHSSDEAFHDFRKKLRTCIHDLVDRPEDADCLLTSESERIVARRDVEAHAAEEVTEYCFLRVNYESKSFSDTEIGQYSVS
ncbi:hypothetical protein BDY19DRAFT_1059668 [Irpex rosettiformis]|uniref:Uncharacterized protein n=1 Tax=Irpex rosettiformis TaxID=378272 RepID=A0ACB8TTB8_9APHY|nr:hypothetical protein BDY19DRAFT_1059668 [Irpex rosettiformis]